ncbi:TPA: aminoimidazole riboside kinase [Vibrio cholerae]
MNKIWLTGDAVVDLIPDSHSTYLKCPGGAPANVAVAISRLGQKSAFFGRVGDDPMGKFMISILKQEGVSTDYLRIDHQQRTSTVVVDLDESGERSFTFMVKPSADQFITYDDIPDFHKGEWLHCCSIALANEPSRSTTLEAIHRMKSVGGYVSFDPNLRDEVWDDKENIIPTVKKAIALADVVKFSDDELTYLTNTTNIEEGLSIIERLNIPLVVVTQGKKGALVIFEGNQKLLSVKEIEPVDTTGAGDAFVGGLLARLSQTPSWKKSKVVFDAVHWGNICGGLATTCKGAMTALPTLEQVKRIDTI